MYRIHIPVSLKFKTQLQKDKTSSSFFEITKNTSTFPKLLLIHLSFYFHLGNLGL